MNNSNSISSEPNSYLQEDNNSSNENLIIEKRSNLGENLFHEVTELVNENESLRIESKENLSYFTNVKNSFDKKFHFINVNNVLEELENYDDGLKEVTNIIEKRVKRVLILIDMFGIKKKSL